MRKINKTYKFRLCPNKAQAELLAKHFGCARFVYNYFLNERKEQYRLTGSSDNYYTQAKSLTELKIQDETAWLKEVNSQSLQSSLRNVDTAYTNFFQKRTGFPKFKSKRSKNSFTVPQSARISDNRLFIPKSISDASWGSFVTMLTYKAEWNDKKVVKIDRYFPSSQTCNVCGYINKQTKDLSIREWECPICHTHHNRDVNAAINILRFGLNNTSAGTVDYTGGEEVRADHLESHSSVKPEAHEYLINE